MVAEFADDRDNLYEAFSVDLTDAELTHIFRNALASVKNGESDIYDQIVGVLQYTGYLDSTKTAKLETSLRALSGAVTCIDIVHHRSLLSSIFGMSLWNYGPYVMNALVDLIVSLATTGGKYLDPCLNMLISNFMPPLFLLNKLPGPRVLKKKEEVLPKVHKALLEISHLVPLAPIRLAPLLAQRMPTVHKKDHSVVIYVENLLKLASSSMGEVVRCVILMLVMERLRDLDVEIGWDGVPQDDSSKGIFDMELEDAGDAGDTLSDGDKFPVGPLNRMTLCGHIVSDLLDKLMVLTFEHLKSCQNAGTLGEVFEVLFESFENFILNTYKPKCAQFVMFYACSLDPENCGVIFATKLIDIFVSSNKPPLSRMNAVAYLASYLSHGKFLSPSFVASTLKRLVDDCVNYCRACSDDVIRPKAHQVFYTGCEAIMFVLCFRMRSILDVPRLQSLFTPLESILEHKLNPLMVCPPSVVAEFLRQAKAADLFTISETLTLDDLLESGLSRGFGGGERLDMFCFDPWLLKTSDSFIRPNFIYWWIVRTTTCDNDIDIDIVADEDDDNDDAEVIVNDVEMMMERSFNEDDDPDQHAMNELMSITPEHSFKNKLERKKFSRMPSIIRPSTSPQCL